MEIKRCEKCGEFRAAECLRCRQHRDLMISIVGFVVVQLVFMAYMRLAVIGVREGAQANAKAIADAISTGSEKPMRKAEELAAKERR